MLSPCGPQNRLHVALSYNTRLSPALCAVCTAGLSPPPQAEGASASAPAPSRKRPYIYVYDLPPAYNARMLQYRVER